MDAQQITEMLAKMEQNLQGVESARQQVQQVANAYSSTRAQLESLTSTIHQMSDDMTLVINSLKENQKFISDSYKDWLLGNFDDFGQKTEGLANSAKFIQTQFKRECEEASSGLSKAVDANLTKLQNQFDDTIKALNEKATAEINGISEKINTFKTEASQIRKNFEQESTKMSDNFKLELSKSSEEHKSAEETVIEDFKKSVDDYKSSFEQTKKDMEVVLCQYKKEIDDFWKKMTSMLTPIASSINEVSMKEDVMQKQIQTNKILLIAILISVLISIAIRFI